MTTPPSRTSTELASDLVTYAARLVRAVRRDAELPAWARVVSLLDEHGPTGVSALAQADRCSQPTMSAAVKELVAQGWAQRRPHPDDSRSQLVELTDAGRAELGRIRLESGRLIAGRLTRHPTHTPVELATAVAVLRDLTVPQEGSS